MKYKIDLALKKYKGKELENRVLMSCVMENLTGDCSGYSVGMVSRNNFYRLEDDDKEIMYKLLAHKIVHNIHFLSDRSVDKTWCNKYVFTGPSDFWEGAMEGEPLKRLYDVFLSLTKHKEQAITTRGWHGKDYDMRVVTIPKGYRHQIPLEGIEWKGMEIQVELYRDGQLVSRAPHNQIQSLETIVKRHQW